MRFGRWAAVAAVALCAGQAEAATFVQFQAQGTGTLSVQNGATSYSKIGDLFFNFTLEVDPGYSDGQSYGTGSYFQNINIPNVFTAALSGGTLTITDSEGASQYKTLGSGTITLPSPAAAVFSDIPSSTAASGTVSYGNGTPSGGTNISGTVSKLVRLGVVNQFLSPSASVLPEPSAWMTMILGTAAIGFGLRRRRTTLSVLA